MEADLSIYPRINALTNKDKKTTCIYKTFLNTYA